MKLADHMTVTQVGFMSSVLNKQCTLLLSLLLTSAAVAAEPAVPDGWFVWPMGAGDIAAGSALDASSLNRVPAGKAGRVTVKDGHFLIAGERVRFFATNLGSYEAFPSREAATAVAVRLAHAGINLVRLHHLDNCWTIHNGGSLWDRTRKDRQHFDPAQLDRLDWLVAQLQAQGIYVNFNLKVSKELTADDDMPPSIAELPFRHQKRVDFFQTRMIELQQEYARRLLGHVNPYTQQRYADDPGVAAVEINNENSLISLWSPDLGLGLGLDRLPEPFRGELVGRWTTWLKNHYATDAAVTAAWMKGTTPPGEPLLAASRAWTQEAHGDSALTIAPQSSAKGAGCAPDLAIEVIKVSGTSWHVQVHQVGLTLTDGATYTVSFRARAAQPRDLGVNVGLSKADWKNNGLSASVRLGTEWSEHRLFFVARDTLPGFARLSFHVGDAIGHVELADVDLCPGAIGAGLQPGETLAAGVSLPVNATHAQWADWIQFLADTEHAYAEVMRTLLKDELKVQAPIIVSQIDYGGLAGLAREQTMDYADAHAYWQHPTFKGDGWDPEHWTIDNSPQVLAMEARGFGELGNLSLTRVAGKPFSISEYDHPAPSDYVCEMLPELASHACQQDWDALYTFCFGAYSESEKVGHIGGFFDQQHHPAKWGFYPATARVFRLGLVPPLAAVAELRLPDPLWSAGWSAGEAWRRLIPDGPYGFLERRFQVSDHPQAGGEAHINVHGTPSPGAVRLVATSQGRVYAVAAPAFCALVGHLGGADVTAGDLQVAATRFGRDFAACTAVALDGNPLRASKRVLITLCGRAENQGMGWDAGRTTVSNTWGRGPVIVERVPATLRLTTDGARTVYALRPDGTRAQTVASTRKDGVLTFAVAPGQDTIHYEVVAE